MISFVSRKGKPECDEMPASVSTQLYKLGNPVFLLALMALIANDWWLKPMFHNGLTGKMSDFAGLYAFPFACSAIFPGWNGRIHLFTAILFIFWKSELSEPVLQFFNGLNIPMHRTPDPTDYIALISVAFSFAMFGTKYAILQRKIALNTVLIVSAVSFVATSIPYNARQYTSINKSYHFDVPKRNLVSGLNALILDEMSSLMKTTGAQIDFDGTKNIFHYRGSSDTLAQIIDHNHIERKTKIYYRSMFAEIVVEGNEHKSSLTLTRILRLQSMGTDSTQRQKAIRVFERRVIKKIKRYSATPPTMSR